VVKLRMLCNKNGCYVTCECTYCVCIFSARRQYMEVTVHFVVQRYLGKIIPLFFGGGEDEEPRGAPFIGTFL
jgi:hypothetical protein